VFNLVKIVVSQLLIVLTGSVFLSVAGLSSAYAKVAVVLNSGEGTVSLIDKVTKTEVKRFPVGKEPHHLMATPDDQYLIVANAASNDLVFLDPKTGEIKRRIDNISDPYQIGFSPNRKWFVSVSLRLDRTDIYDGNFKLAKRIATPKAPSHVAFTSDSKLAFITLQDSNQLAAIDLETQAVKWTMSVGKMPAGVWVTPDDKYVLIGMTAEDYVEVVDWRTQKSIKKIKTGKGAHNFIAMGDGRRLLLSNRVANTISMIDQQTLSVIDTINVPGGPDCMELSADGRELWVTSRWAKKVTIVDLPSKQIQKQIPVGKSPHGIYFFGHAPRK
jgi:YVTN family beta-propeller protein